jgi:L-lactate dehydrogenase complex protein LldE
LVRAGGANWLTRLLSLEPSSWRGSPASGLLAAVREAEIVDLPASEECCGFGGVFSVEHPEISAEMLKRKIKNLETSQSPTLVVADTGCRMHIAGDLHRQEKPQKVVHIAEVLKSY